jgi:hypothetical protein
VPGLSFSIAVCDVNIRDVAEEERAGTVSAEVRELIYVVVVVVTCWLLAILFGVKWLPG